MIFLDSNIPMYIAGPDHPHKIAAQVQIQRCIAAGERMVADAEVLQEILHRYAAIRRPEVILPCLQWLLATADEIFPVETCDVLRAAEIIASGVGLSARDALHVAIMQRRAVSRILSFDADFDRWPGITRLGALN